MHKRHRQNNCIIFQYYLPSHQHNCSIGQKGPSFQSNRIVEACCWDTTPWPAWPHQRCKISFYEDASSDVDTGTSRWVPGRLSKVDETAVQLQCPWLYGSCSLRHMRAPVHCHVAAVDIGSAFPSNSLQMPGAVFSAVHCSRVQSWLSYVEGNPPAAHLCNTRKLWPWLFHPTAECETSWVAVSWRVSSALTPVWWQDSSDGFLVHRQLQCGTNCCLS